MSSAKASRMIPASSGAAAAAASSSRASSSIAPSSSSSLCRRLFFQPRRRPLAGGPALAAPNKSAGEAVAELLAAAVAGDETTLLDFVAEEAAVSIAERTAQRRRREQKREEREEEEKDAAGGGEERSSSGEKLTPLTLEDVVRAARPEELSLDSFAVRSLVLCPRPLRAATAVSGLSPAPGKFLARAALALPSGEEMTLTLSLVEEERAVAHYKSVRTERHWALVSARGEPCSSSSAAATATEEEAADPTEGVVIREARHGPEVVLDAFLSALARGDGATVAGLTGAKAGAGARALADAVGGSLFAPPKGQGGDKDEEQEQRGGGGSGESVPPWLRGSENDDGDGGGDSPSSPSSSSRRFPRELEPLVALFLSGSHYDLLSVKMLSARQAWGMAGVRPLGDDGSGFILGGGGAAGQQQPPPSAPPSSTSSRDELPSTSPPNQRRRQKQWQEELQQQQQQQHPRAAFIFRLELCAEDGCWEVRDVARVGGGGGGGSGGGAFSLGG